MRGKISSQAISNNTLALTTKSMLIVPFVGQLASAMRSTLIVSDVDVDRQLLALTIKVDADSRR